MSQEVKITTKSIRRILKSYNFCGALTEYVWNGFDAHANCIEISYTADAIGHISELSIEDDGYGIDEGLLDNKFKPFYDSEKFSSDEMDRNHSIAHGKNGVGRLTFFTFAKAAIWNTSFKKDNNLFSYSIKIESDKLDKFQKEGLTQIKGNKSGTKIDFHGIHGLNDGQFTKVFIPFLKREFAWFLELNKSNGLSIKINGEVLDYSDCISNTDNLQIVDPESRILFTVNYIQWKSLLNSEYSKYYYIASDDQEKWKKTTTLNKKGDSFYHSVFIKSTYFDDFNFEGDDNGQISLSGGTPSDKPFKFLHTELTKFLRKKRKPFLKESAKKLVEEYEKEGVISGFKSDPWEQLRKQDLKEVLKGLYEIQPRIFTELNPEQKNTFVGLLGLILESEERDKVLNIIQKVTQLDSDERAQLSDLLNRVKLSHVINTIKLIENRFKVVEQLKELVFNDDLNANERDHLQNFVQNNYWIFGEQYHLVAAAEVKFERALKDHIKILTGIDREVRLNSPNKNGEMDIFICRKNIHVDTIDNIIVELKHPNVGLGEDQLSQVKRYMRVIMELDECNAPNMNWEFYLIGNKFDTSGFIEGEMLNAGSHGEKSLVYKQSNLKIFVKTWSELFTEFDCRYQFLNEKMQFEKDTLIGNYQSADQIILELAKQQEVGSLVK